MPTSNKKKEKSKLSPSLQQINFLQRRKLSVTGSGHIYSWRFLCIISILQAIYLPYIIIYFCCPWNLFSQRFIQQFLVDLQFLQILDHPGRLTLRARKNKSCACVLICRYSWDDNDPAPLKRVKQCPSSPTLACSKDAVVTHSTPASRIFILTTPSNVSIIHILLFYISIHSTVWTLKLQEMHIICTK